VHSNAVKWFVPVSIAIVLLYFLKPGGGGFLRAPVPGQSMPAWEMTDLEGNPVSSTRYDGQIRVINFWATWCPPCIRELPELESFSRENADKGVVVLGASIDEADDETLRSFVKARSLTFPVLRASEQVQRDFGGIQSIPSTFIVDREGAFVARYIGAITRNELTRAIAPLLRQPTPKEAAAEKETARPEPATEP
jgi:thiol-disulfide isomerase/thioredoxin